MRLLGLALAAASVMTVLAKPKEENGVIVLTEANFEETVKEYDPLLVAFVAPWCGHCKKLKPEYEKAAKELKKEGLKLAKVDATKEKELATRFGIDGFPTLKFFRAGEPTEYNGGRDKESIVQWVKKRSGPAATVLATPEDITGFLEDAEVAVVAFVEDKDSKLAKAVLSVAGGNDDVPFGVVYGTDANAVAARAAYDVAASGDAVLSFNNFEDQPNRVTLSAEATQAADAAAISSWVSTNALPLVVTFGQDTAPKIFKGDIKTHFLLFAEEEDATVPAFRAAAKASTGGAIFVRVPPSEDRVLGYFGITQADLPTAVIVNMAEGGMKKYKWRADTQYTTEAFTAFLEDYKAAKLSPWLKSEAAPDAAANAAAPVKTIVGTTFEADVISNDKDVLFEVYAPWCGHCKKLAPTYEALGKAIQAAGITTLHIAKMDGTANEIDYPGVNVRGFPTILFFPAGNKAKPIDYDGARDAEGMVKFLQEHATHGAAGLKAEDVEALVTEGGDDE